MIQKLKNLYVSMARTAESGSDFQMGVVYGQVMKELESIINEHHEKSPIVDISTSSDHASCPFPTPVGLLERGNEDLVID